MDWKAWYREEVRSDSGRAAVREALARHPHGDPAIRSALRRGGAVSFPHTTLRGSADPLACVATSIREEGFRRVVALGVLHGSTLPEPEREAARALHRGDARAFAAVGGAFDDASTEETPFGPVPTGPEVAAGPWVRRSRRILAKEFSLDLFLAVLAAAHDGRARLPEVTRLYVGATVRDGSAHVAESIAEALRPLLGADAALVATGDLAHAGHGYSTPEEIAALPTSSGRLEEHFAARVLAMLEASFDDPPRLETADALAREIRSDQRHLAPVLAELVGAGSTPRLLSFALTDYGPVLGEPPPCVVASALVAVERRSRGVEFPSIGGVRPADGGA